LTDDASYDARHDAELEPPRRSGLGDAPQAARQLVARVAAELRERTGAWREAPADAVAAFVDLLIGPDPRAAESHVSSLLARGVSADRLYGGYLAGAARELGRQWDQDLISFADVGLGMARLQRLLRDLSPALLGGRLQEGGATAPSALVAAAPSERHVFGALMFGDHLRRLGWRVEVEIGGDAGAVRDACARAAPDVAALSIACRVNLPGLRTLIGALRAGPRPPRLIAVGGPLAQLAADDLRACGADLIAATASDVQAALARGDAERPRFST